MRSGEKLNKALLPQNEVIWVRNCSHFGKEFPYFQEFSYPVMHEGEEYWFYEEKMMHCYRWVRMSVSLALKRTQKWKEANVGETLPEWLTEFFLLEEQSDRIWFPNLKEKMMLSLANKF